MNHTKLLAKLGACQDAIDWYAEKDSQEAWESCERGDWLLWIAAHLGVDKTLLILAARDFASTAIATAPTGSLLHEALHTVGRWACGQANMDAVRDAAEKAAERAAKLAVIADAAFATLSASASAYHVAAVHGRDASPTLNDTAHVVARMASTFTRTAADTRAAMAAASATKAATYGDAVFLRCSESFLNSLIDAAWYADSSCGGYVSAAIVRRKIPWTLIHDAIANYTSEGNTNDPNNT